jgi:tetratricopeptide (TPR) repeat protein
MDARLSAEQVAQLRQATTLPSPKELAKQAGISKEEAAAVLADLDSLSPAWAGREEPKIVLALGALLILIASLFAYSGNTDGAFLFDDKQAIAASEVSALRVWSKNHVREDDPLKHKLSVFREGAEKTLDGLFAYNRFRVVTYATFAWEDWWFEDSKEGQVQNGGLFASDPAFPEPHVHTFNNLIHAFNGLLALWLAYLTFTSPAFAGSKSAFRYPAAGAVLTGVVFSLHPLQTQAVTYLSQRAESLGTLFFLLALCLLITARRRACAAPEDAKPHLTVFAWTAVMGLSAVLLIAAAKTDLRFSTAVYLGLLVIAGGIGGSVYLVKSGHDEPWHAAAVGGGIVAFLLGLETKEIVGVFPAVLLAHHLLFDTRPSKEVPAESVIPAGPAFLNKLWLWRAIRSFGTAERLRYNAPWVSGILLVLLAFPILGGTNFRNQLLGPGVEMGGRQSARLTSSNYLLTQANVLHTYVRLGVLPYGQNVDHDYPLAMEPILGTFDPTNRDVGPHKGPLVGPEISSPLTTLLSLLGLLAAIALALAAGGRARVAAFATALILLVLGPSSTLIVLADVIFEHRFYLPLLGGALILPVVLERLLRLGPPTPGSYVILGVALLLAVVGGTMVSKRNEVWKTDQTLWEDATQKSPNKPRGWVNLGNFWGSVETHIVRYRVSNTKVTEKLCQPRPMPGGEEVLLVSLSQQVMQPTVVSVGNILAVAEFKEAKDAPQKAKDCYSKAVAIEPYGKALNNLALSSVYQLQYLQQEERIVAQTLLPRYEQKGDRARIQACQARLAQIPEQMAVYAKDAEHCFMAKLALGRVDFFVYNNLGGLYSLTNKHAKSAEYLKAALTAPGERDMSTWAALGEALQKWGVTRWRWAHQGGQKEQAVWIDRARSSWQEAKTCYQRFLREKPNAVQASFVRNSIAELDAWLAGNSLPNPQAPIWRTAVVE